MDALSQILSGIRLRSPLIADICFGEDAAVDFGSAAGIPFHHVLSGEATLSFRGGEERLRANQLALLPDWQPYQIATASDAAPVSIIDLAEAQGQPLWSLESGVDRALHLETGMPPWRARILSGILVLDRGDHRVLFGDHKGVIVRQGLEPALHSWASASEALLVGDRADPRPGFAAVAVKLLELLLTEVLRDWLLTPEGGNAWFRAFASPNLRRAIEEVHRDPARRWSVASLATAAGQSRSRFAEAFRDACGDTPMRYVRWWRNYLAAQRLRDTSDPIVFIATALGYTDPKVFSRVFRGEHGITPAAYRKARAAHSAAMQQSSLPGERRSQR